MLSDFSVASKQARLPKPRACAIASGLQHSLRRTASDRKSKTTPRYWNTGTESTSARIWLNVSF